MNRKIKDKFMYILIQYLFWALIMMRFMMHVFP